MINPALITGINYTLLYIHIETADLHTNNVFVFFTVFFKK